LNEPTPEQARPPWRIALISAVVLILELALIRQIPAEVRAISYFTNLILMAAFLGLGIGCILQERRNLAWTLPVGLLLTGGFTFAARGITIYSGSEAVHYWLKKPDATGQAMALPLAPAAILAFVFTAIAFVGLGQKLAREMQRHPRLLAYGWDIGGSLAGTLIFVLASWVRLPPWVWPPVLMLVWAVVFQRGIVRQLAFVASGAAFIAFAFSPLPSTWSPYYLVQHAEEDRGTRVWVNSGFHQFAVDFSPENEAAGWLQGFMQEKWGVPYVDYRTLHQGRSPEKVLVLGAGTGNDVNIALANGAREVVAVEIDPVILGLGRRLNRTRPYDDPRVRTVVDDARHFLRSSRESFDLIVFGTIDSQTLLSSQANLRMENYVYTREALEDARRLLVDRGMVAIYYSVARLWLYGRIHATVRSVFGEQMHMRHTEDTFLFNTIIVAAKGIAELHDDPEAAALHRDARPSSDDWPFIYLERPTIAPVYLYLFVFIGALIVGALFLLRRVHPGSGLHVNFLLLGMGFTLMESSAIVRLALLFGSTWIVNAVVFGAALATIFLANLSVLKRWAPPIGVAWPVLWLFVAINLVFPLHVLTGLGPGLRVLAAGGLVGIPIYFAALCFSYLFGREKLTGYPLGINLVGAMAGGPVEYLSMLIGMRGVWAIVLVVYVLAWVATRSDRRFGKG